MGALMFWSTDGRAGHVALYVGNGQIASNDIREPGRISIVPATDIESKWGLRTRVGRRRTSPTPDKKWHVSAF
ncbi:hypothetical protein SHKM778_95070 (plasmid) [Streptomyces sp. KM77-8]|uniref:NlpC/P60 domain-containing protein n=1 Tax=Streptomyces haneummycinicus TaxID=3074435 RepID=A0AAT9I0R4_9ACTN